VQFLESSFGALLAEEKPEIEDTADDLIGEVVFGVSGGFDDVHGVGASEVVDVEEVVFFSQHIQREVSVCLQTLTVIDDLSSISVENRPFSISLSERRLETLADTVEIITVDFGSDLKVVVTEDDGFIVGGKKNGAILSADNSEIEGRFSVFKRDSGCCKWE
jgi:hypothetical protein